MATSPPAESSGASQPALETSIEFIGTATTILRLGPFTLLSDPNFLHRGQRVYLGYGLFSKRVTEPAKQPQELPAIDAIVLSHLHGDHFDRIARKQLDRDLPIVTTPAAAGKLHQWGFAAAHGTTTWQSWELHRGDDRLTVTACPGQHGPAVVDRLLPSVMGSVIDLHQGARRVLRVYITGDTLCRPYLRQIAERFPGLDAMIIHLGGTRALGILVTMDARQGAELVGMIDPALTIPIHYDDYTVFRSPLSEFIAEAQRRGFGDRVQTISRGEVLDLAAQTR